MSANYEEIKLDHVEGYGLPKEVKRRQEEPPNFPNGTFNEYKCVLKSNGTRFPRIFQNKFVKAPFLDELIADEEHRLGLKPGGSVP